MSAIKRRIQSIDAHCPRGGHGPRAFDCRTADRGSRDVADEPISASWKGLLSITQAASFDTVELRLEGDVGNDAMNPPTKARVGALEGWLFDDVAEKRTLAFIVPRNWQGATDLRVRLFQVLGQAESGGNAIQWAGEVRTLARGQEKVAKTPTVLVDGVTDSVPSPTASTSAAVHT